MAKPRKYLVFMRYSRYNKVRTFSTLKDAREYGIGHIYKFVE